MRGLTGKTAIVTGGGSGIGRAICMRLAAEGILVGVFDTPAGALAYRTRGTESVLQRLASAADSDDDRRLEALACSAIRAWRDGLVDDPELLDVAAVVGGLAPAYTGGPMTYAWQHQDRMAGEFRATVGTQWEALERRLAAAYSLPAA